MNSLSNKHLVLDELHKAFDRKYSASDVLDGKLQNMLNFLSIIVAIAPTVAGSTLFDKIGFLFWIPIAVVLVLYWVSFQKIMHGLTPGIYVEPISKDWNELKRRYFAVRNVDVLELIISEHLYSLEDAGKQNLRKAKCIHDTILLMRWIVILLLISVPVGLLIPAPTLSELVRALIVLLSQVRL